MASINFFINFELLKMILICIFDWDKKVHQKLCHNRNLAVHDEKYLYSRAVHVDSLILWYKEYHVKAAYSKDYNRVADLGYVY